MPRTELAQFQTKGLRMNVPVKWLFGGLVMTLGLNSLSRRIVKRYRQEYE